MNIRLVNILIGIFLSFILKATPADSLLLLGTKNLKKGEFLLAEKNFKQARYLSKDYYTKARILNNLGVLYQQQYLYDSALVYYSFLERLLVENDDKKTLVTAYNNKAIVYYNLYDYDRSLDYYQKALSLSRDKEKFSLLNNIGCLYLDLSQLDSAIYYLKMAELYVTGHKRLKLYLNIASTLGKIGNEEASIKYFRKSFDNQDKSSIYDYLDLLIIYGRRFSDRDSIQKAVSIADRLNTRNLKTQALYYLSLTFNESDSSLFYLKQIVDKEPSNSLSAWINIDALIEIGNIYYRQNKLEKALQYYQKAIDKFAYNRRIFTSNEDKKGVNDKYSSLFIAASEVCLKLYEKEQNDSLLHLAFDYADMIKASIFKEQVKSDSIPDSMLLQERKLNAQIEKGQPEAIFEKEKFLEQLKTNYPEYYENRFSFKTGLVKGLSAKLTEQQQLISYIYSDSLLLRFSVNSAGVSAERFYIDSLFFRSIKDFTYYIHNSDTRKKDYKLFVKGANYIYPLLVGEDFSHELIIIPWKSLYKISFDCLFKIDSIPTNYEFYLPYLIYDHAISYHYSAGLLDFKERAAKNAYLYAPDYSKTNKRVIPLKDDLKTIREFISPKVLDTISFIGDIFHLTVHGTPRYIYLEDDSISISDVSSLKSTNLLTMLTACQSAEGRINSEGEESFARALLQAGSQSVIVSEWKLMSPLNVKIFDAFYRELNKGKKLNVALQKAKIEYLNDVSFGSQRHPHYWAPLSLYGNIKSIEEKTSNDFWYIAGFFIIVLLLSFSFFKYSKRKV